MGEYGGEHGLEGGVDASPCAGQASRWLRSWLSGIDDPQLWHTSTGQNPYIMCIITSIYIGTTF